MQSLHTPSDLSVMFDDDHAVANAGLALAGLLSEKLGLEELCDETISIAPFPGRRAATLVHSLVIGGTCIDDADVLRSGSTASVLSHRVMAPSTLGTFLRGFTFGHVRQLDSVTEQLLTRAWALGAGPGDDPHDHRSRLHDLRSPRHPQAGRLLRLHQGARLSPGARHARRHRRGVAPALSKRIGQHPARRPALRERDRGPGSPRRGEWRFDATCRLGVLLQVRDPSVP